MRIRGQLSRGEGRSLEYILPGSTTCGDQQMPRLHFFSDVLDRDDPRSAAKDQRIVNEGIVKLNGPIDRRDAHAIPIITNATHHPAHHAQRMDYVFGLQIFLLGVWRPKAEHIDRGHRFGPLPCA